MNTTCENKHEYSCTIRLIRKALPVYPHYLSKGNGIRIPATEETKAAFARARKKAMHNQRLMDKYGLTPQELMDRFPMRCE